jgi:hypothetical protein
LRHAAFFYIINTSKYSTEIIIMALSNIKTANAARVLNLMDSVEDGDGRYTEFVALVAKDANITTGQLDSELDAFI